ncbi:MAG: hypothetical protein WA208_00785 [Thermoanaerobaculia bacterium]
MKHSPLRIAALLLGVLLLIAPPMLGQIETTDREGEQVGNGEVIVNPAVSTALTVPSGAQWAVLTVAGAAVHVEFDGTAATTNDLQLGPGTYRTSFVYRPSPRPTFYLLPKIRMINGAGGAATVYVKYFRIPEPT